MTIKQQQDAYIVEAVRTPIGKAPRGVFSKTRPDDLLAHCLKELRNRTASLDYGIVDDVVLGCAMPEAEQGMNVARIALLLAGYPNTVGGITVNRFCSSGLQAVAYAAQQIQLGQSDAMVAAGVETMSLIPMMGHKVMMNPAVFANDENLGIAYGMGMTAENVAHQWKISREAQDQFALQSHQKAVHAIKEGFFKDEVAPYEVASRTANLKTGQVEVSKQTVENDEGARPDSSLETLAKLRPVFSARGSVTAGNSSQMSDGAAAILVVSEEVLKRHNLKPLARFINFSVAGVPPEIMGIGPKEAVPKVLKRAGLSLDQMDWIELNEAFAAQSLAVIQDLGLNPEVVNPCGGAIATGHPLGATGAIKTATLVHGMKRKQAKYGMVTMCIGTGMGAAGVFENLT